MSRVIWSEKYGTVAIINGYVYLLNIFMDSGMTISIIRNKDITDKEVSAIFTFNFALSILFTILTLVSSPFIENYFDIPDLGTYLNYSSIILMLNSLAFVRYARMEQNMQFRKESFINISSMVAAGAVCIYMLTLGYGIFAVVLFSISATFMKNLLYLIFTPRFRVMKFDFNALKPHLHFGKNLLVSSTVEAVYNNGFPVLINKLFGGYSAGIFFQSKRLVDWAVQLVSASSRRLFLPSASKAGNDLQTTFTLLQQVLKFVNYILVFLVAVLFINSNYLIVKLMGSEWEGSVLLMKIIIFGMIFYAPYFLCIDVFKVMGDSKAYSNTVFYSRLFSIGLILLSSLFGFLYLVIFFSFAQLLMFASAVIQLKRKYNYHPMPIIKTIYPPIVSMIAGLVVADFISLGGNIILDLIIKTTIFALIYLSISAFVFQFNPLMVLYRKIKK
ncbi:oligosaccharide flippase family protein [Flavobacterium sp. 3HN19-14]|uniref:oligosaccharide flippase family protein n=1 Tax=Flavobacterium sp. 3HN19-14 TaxID=3448133 RepID=UPI003EDF990A